jgi:hypothetical protein
MKGRKEEEEKEKERIWQKDWEIAESKTNLLLIRNRLGSEIKDLFFQIVEPKLFYFAQKSISDTFRIIGHAHTYVNITYVQATCVKIHDYVYIWRIKESWELTGVLCRQICERSLVQICV